MSRLLLPASEHIPRALAAERCPPGRGCRSAFCGAGGPARAQSRRRGPSELQSGRASRGLFLFLSSFVKGARGNLARPRGHRGLTEDHPRNQSLKPYLATQGQDRSRSAPHRLRPPTPGQAGRQPRLASWYLFAACWVAAEQKYPLDMYAFAQEASLSSRALPRGCCCASRFVAGATSARRSRARLRMTKSHLGAACWPL